MMDVNIEMSPLSLYNDTTGFAQDEYDYSYYESSPPKYDYSVLAVALITMGLIVPVEIVRHKVDHRAVGRPFAKTVLDFLYSECEYEFLISTSICAVYR